LFEFISEFFVGHSVSCLFGLPNKKACAFGAGFWFSS